MRLELPDSLVELEGLADDLSDLLDSFAAGAIDCGPRFQRLLVGLLEEVEAEIRLELSAAEEPVSREVAWIGAHAQAAPS
jgi:hypothetical protein